MLKERTSISYVDPANIGLAEYGLGLREDAFRHMEEACEARSTWLTYFKAFPAFRTLTSDPRYESILARMGLA